MLSLDLWALALVMSKHLSESARARLTSAKLSSLRSFEIMQTPPVLPSRLPGRAVEIYQILWSCFYNSSRFCRTCWSSAGWEGLSPAGAGSQRGDAQHSCGHPRGMFFPALQLPPPPGVTCAAGGTGTAPSINTCFCPFFFLFFCAPVFHSNC